jgi:protocatechuate 3,4-dioxygenase beta subunit
MGTLRVPTVHLDQESPMSGHLESPRGVARRALLGAALAGAVLVVARAMPPVDRFGEPDRTRFRPGGELTAESKVLLGERPRSLSKLEVRGAAWRHPFPLQESLMFEDPAENHLTRRTMFGAAAAAGAGLIATRVLPSVDPLGGANAQAAEASVAAACTTLTPDLTEGPYWLDEKLHRVDVRANTASAASLPGVAQAGVPLALTINVFDADKDCAALNGAAVDIWHANAAGLYSGEASQGAGGGTIESDTSGQNYLRGYQVTGVDRGLKSAAVDGQVTFQTIWPGWYTGRAIHIHVRVRTYNADGSAKLNYTTQIFFSDSANDTVLSGAAPYRSRSPQDDPTTDENDSVLSASADSTNIVAVSGSVSVSDGFAATFNIMLNSTTDYASAGAGPGSGGAGGGAGGPGAAGGVVEATLIGASVKKNRSTGSRLITVGVQTGEAAILVAELVRGRKVLVRKAIIVTGAGSHVLHLDVSRHVAKGGATLLLTATDQAKQVKTLTKSLALP